MPKSGIFVFPEYDDAFAAAAGNSARIWVSWLCLTLFVRLFFRLPFGGWHSISCVCNVYGSPDDESIRIMQFHQVTQPYPSLALWEDGWITVEMTDDAHRGLHMFHSVNTCSFWLPHHLALASPYGALYRNNP